MPEDDEQLLELRCERCGRELDALFDPICNCAPTTDGVELPEPEPAPEQDAGVRRWINEVLAELEDDE